MSSSTRHQDENILSWLRRLNGRVDRLEKGDKGVRVNDTRLGNTVQTPNTYTNQIEVKNLSTGYVTPIGSIRETVWSWGGPIDLSEDDDASTWYSPHYLVADDTVAHEIVMMVDGCAIVEFIFGGRLSMTVMATGGLPRIRPIHVPVKKNDTIRLRLIGYEAASNLTAIIRYGQPTENADNYTVESGYGYGCDIPA